MTSSMQEQETPTLTLYHSPTCMFCLKVWYAIKKMGLDIPGRNLLTNPEARKELIAGGGRAMVPCLRIDSDGNTQWLYESNDIIAYLEKLAAN